MKPEEEISPCLRPKKLQRKKRGAFHHGNLKESILAAAIKHIEIQEDVGFTLRDIAKDLGVSHVAVFNHFESKAHLIADIAAQGYGILSSLLVDVRQKKLGVSEGMKSYVNFGLANPGIYRTMFHNSIKPFSDYPHLLESANNALLELNNLFDNGMKTAEFNALTLWTSAHGIVSLALDGQLAGPFGKGWKTDQEVAHDAVRAIRILMNH